MQITFRNLSKSYLVKVILDSISSIIGEGQRIDLWVFFQI